MNILDILFLNTGNKIQIKPSRKGLFTEYCGGKVTDECIQRGKNSKDPKIRKRSTFAANARKWSHKEGGTFGFNVHSPAIQSEATSMTNTWWAEKMLKKKK